MYLNGFKGFGADDYSIFTGDNPADIPSPQPDFTVAPGGAITTVPSASNTGPTDLTNWTGLISTAIKTWGDVTKQQVQSKAQVQTAPYQYRYGIPGMPNYLNPLSPLAAGTPGTIFGLTPNMLLLLAAFGAAFVMLKK